jgi:hypothetical protein
MGTEEAKARWHLLTLDTCCISALANPMGTEDRSEVAALERIVDLAREGRVQLQVAAAYERDASRWHDVEGLATRAAWLASVPELRRAPGIFRLDVSQLGADMLGSQQDVDLDRQLRSILRPSLAARTLPSHEEEPGATAKFLSDIDHLVAHRRSGADAFVTIDDKTLLKRTKALLELGIVVCKPTRALASLSPMCECP